MLVARSVANGQPLDTLLEASCSAACSCHCRPTRSKQYSTKLWQFYTTIDNSSMTRFQMISMICHFPYFHIFSYIFHIFHISIISIFSIPMLEYQTAKQHVQSNSETSRWILLEPSPTAFALPGHNRDSSPKFSIQK